MSMSVTLLTKMLIKIYVKDISSRIITGNINKTLACTKRIIITTHIAAQQRHRKNR